MTKHVSDVKNKPRENKTGSPVVQGNIGEPAEVQVSTDFHVSYSAEPASDIPDSIKVDIHEAYSPSTIEYRFRYRDNGDFLKQFPEFANWSKWKTYANRQRSQTALDNLSSKYKIIEFRIRE
jgi:hypothetical protein